MFVQDRLPVVAVTDSTPSVDFEISSSTTRVLAPNEFLFRNGRTQRPAYTA